MTEPVAFRDLPPDSFPFVAELFDIDSGIVRWSVEVSGPGSLHIPSVAEINDGRPVGARLRWPDGTVETFIPSAWDAGRPSPSQI